MKRWQKIFFIVLGIVLVVGAGYFGYQGQSQAKDESETAVAPPTVEVTKGSVKQTIISPGRLVNYQTVGLSAGTSGPVTDVYVRPGDIVKSGDVLVRFGNSEQLEAGVVSAQISKIEAEQALNDLYLNAPLTEAQALQAITKTQQEVVNSQYWVSSLNAEPDEVDIAAARSKVVLLAKQLEDAEKAFAPYRDKPDGDLNKAQTQAFWASAQQAYDNALRILNNLTGSPSDLTQLGAKADLAAAEANLAISQANYDVLENGINPSDLTRAEANLKKAELDLALAEAELNSVDLKAPFDGVILSVSVQEGDTVNTGAEVIKFANPKALEVLTSIVEEDYPLIKVGQNVDLYFDAVPGVVGSGKVERIIPKRISEDRPLYQVYISMEEVPEGVVEGMTVDISIILEAQSEVLRLPRALVRANSDGTAQVTVWENGKEEKRSITVGLRGDLFIEILEGVNLGDMVVGQ